MEELQNFLNSIRRDFADKALNEDSIAESPYQQFENWFEEAVNAQLLDPYAMSVSTVSNDGQPSTRVVYLRGIDANGFKFYTNYNSQKGDDLINNNKVSLNFFWGELERQIRIEGRVIKLSEEESDAYFNARPRESKIGAWASNQSEIINDRQELESKVTFYEGKFKNQEVLRPPHWGGYLVKPTKIEFWQGRSNRLHDRIVYSKNESTWKISRVSP